MNKAIILVDHGSKNSLAHLELETLIKKLKEKLDGVSLFLSHMEIAEPLLSDVLVELAEDEIKEIKILPLFIFNGKHLVKDIPQIIESFLLLYPEVKIELMGGLGTDNGFLNYLTNRLK